MKLTGHEIGVAIRMRDRGASVRGRAKHLGVTEGALRYRLKRAGEDVRPDGRARQATALDGYEEAVAAVQEIARHRRGTQALLLLEKSHYEGSSTDRVIRPTPLGRRGRLQVAGVPANRERAAWELAPQEGLERPLSEYARLVERLG